MRHWCSAAATAAAVVAVAVAGSTPAMAAPAAPAGTALFVKSLQDAQTGRCLDSNAAGNVYPNPCQAPGNQYQDWIENVYTNAFGFHYYSFRDVATGRWRSWVSPSSPTSLHRGAQNTDRADISLAAAAAGQP